MTTASYSGRRGRVCRPSVSASARASAARAACRRRGAAPAGRPSAGRAPGQAASASGASGVDPVVGDLVAREKAPQVAAARVPAVAEDRDLRPWAPARDALQAADALARERADLFGDLGRRRGDGVVMLRLDAHDARRLGGAIAAGKRRREGQRHLAEDRAGQAPAERALDAVELLHHLELAREHREERALAAFVNRELAGARGMSARGPHQALELALGSVANSGMARTSSIVSMDPNLPRATRRDGEV